VTENFKSLVSISIEQSNQKDISWKFPEEKCDISQKALIARGRKYARLLSDRGVGEQDRVGLLLNNSMDYVALLLGVWSLNAIAVPLRPISGMFFDYKSYLMHVQDNCQFATLIFTNDTKRENITTWENHSGKTGYYLKDLVEQVETTTELTSSTPNSPDSLAVIQYSSGSTGQPKGVMVTHRMVIEQLHMLKDAFEVGVGIGTLASSASWLPFNHDMGLFIGILQPLFLGAHNILSTPRYFMFKPHRWYQLLAENKANLCFSTNTAMASTLPMLKRLSPETDLSSLYIYFGAEKLSDVVLKNAYKTFKQFKMTPKNFLQGYGMAEYTLGCTGTRRDEITVISAFVHDDNCVEICGANTQAAQSYTSCGDIFINTKVGIYGENDQLVDALTLGEIRVAGNSLMGGYYNNEDISKKALRTGMLHTNDLGFMYNGELYFHSRKDDLIIIGGKNIVPDDIELNVENLDFVKAGGTALISTEKENGEYVLRLLVEQKPSSAEELQNFRKKIQEQVYKGNGVLLNHITFCERGTIETTSSGKKRRKVIRERFTTGKVNSIEA